jgi:hypothetical protein
MNKQVLITILAFGLVIILGEKSGGGKGGDFLRIGKLVDWLKKEFF